MMTEYAGLALSAIEDLASRETKAETGDLVTEDGTITCGKCGWPKRMWIDWIPDENGVSEKRLVPVMCRCRQEAYEAEEQERKREQFVFSLLRARELYGLQTEDGSFFKEDDSPKSGVSITCRRYVDKWEEMRKANVGMILFGGKGTGKSFYASCIANALSGKLVSSLMTGTSALMIAMQTAREKNEIIEHLNRFSLLVLDDFGAERDTTYGTEIMYSVIDARYRAGKPLIVTTNLDPAMMREESDLRLSRIYDRVLEMCAIPLRVNGESRRSGISDRRRDLAREILKGT